MENLGEEDRLIPGNSPGKQEWLRCNTEDGYIHIADMLEEVYVIGLFNKMFCIFYMFVLESVALSADPAVPGL